jgi:hypothetical protein
MVKHLTLNTINVIALCLDEDVYGQMVISMISKSKIA